jgi:hypothetical protein
MACKYAVDHIDNCRDGLRLQLGKASVRMDVWIFVWAGLGMVEFIPACWNWSLELEGGNLRTEGSQRRFARLLEGGRWMGEQNDCFLPDTNNYIKKLYSATKNEVYIP